MWLESPLVGLMLPAGTGPDHFLLPTGEAALLPADSVSWQVFKNPLSLFIGGVAAVVLELAEPRIRTGVWEHTSFHAEPLKRLQRTGYAAMLSVYGPRTRACALIGKVNGLHEQVRGVTTAGQPYSARDPALLEWVHATASFGFLTAWEDWVAPLTSAERDRFYAEGAPLARLYGANSVPRSAAEFEALLDRMAPQLEPSAIVYEFLEAMGNVPAVATPLRPFQKLLVRAAVESLPQRLRSRLGLGPAWDLAEWQRALVRRVGRATDRVVLHGGPVALSCRRLGLPADYLYARHSTR